MFTSDELRAIQNVLEAGIELGFVPDDDLELVGSLVVQIEHLRNMDDLPWIAPVPANDN